MSRELTELARRAVACKHWRWMPGMLDTAGSRVVEVTDNDWVTLAGGLEPGVYPLVDMGIPDLEDPATLGCLLALVREANSRPYASTQYCGGYWQVEDPRDDRWDTDRGFGPWATEAEALVAALEAAGSGE